MFSKRLAPAFLLLCAGCSNVSLNGTPAAASPATTPNGDVLQRTDRAAPDTPAGVRPAARFRDQAVDTDPSSPRTRDRGQKIEVPTLSQ